VPKSDIFFTNCKLYHVLTLINAFDDAVVIVPSLSLVFC